MGKIINDITALGLLVTRAHMLRLNDADVQFLYSEHLGKPYYKQLAMHMLSDVVVGVEIAGEKALQTIRTVAGVTNPVTAKQQSPQSWRAKYGSEGVKNAVHVSATSEACKRETEYFFSK